MSNNEEVSAFQVVHEGFSTREAIEEAKRCLHCKVPSCEKGCPIGNDIRDFIHELSKGNMGDAMAIINEKSNLPAMCVPMRSSARGIVCSPVRAIPYK